MRFKNIAFLGDSFTWGEGLELYCNTPKWIAQRELKSNWQELMSIQDEDSIQFRETHRFSNIVSNHFNANLYTNQSNGGSLQYVLMHILPIISYRNVKSDVIIVQFSTLNRDTIHFSKETFGVCDCELCNGFWERGQGHIAISNISPLILRSKKDVWYDEPILHKLKDYIQTEYGIDMSVKGEALIDAYEKFEHSVYTQNINHFVEKYSKPLELENTFTFFIDSWEKESSKVLFENEYFVQNVIPLIGYDGNYYTKYLDWEKTFPHKRIIDEFPKTNNNHPTLLQNEYIAKSVIEFLEKKEVKKHIKYI